MLYIPIFPRLYILMFPIHQVRGVRYRHDSSEQVATATGSAVLRADQHPSRLSRHLFHRFVAGTVMYR